MNERRDETPPATFTAVPCLGDCSWDRKVTVDELVVAVGMFLGRSPIECLSLSWWITELRLCSRPGAALSSADGGVSRAGSEQRGDRVSPSRLCI